VRVLIVRARTPKREAFTSLPGFADLRRVQEGRVVTLDDQQSAALSFSSILSLPAVLDTVPAQLAAAMDPVGG